MKKYLTIGLFLFLVAVISVVGFPTNADAALTYHSGFEMGDFSEWASTTGSPSVQGTTKKTGSYAMQCDTTGGAATAYVASSASVRHFTFYLYIASAPSADCIIAGVWDGSVYRQNIKLTTARYIDLYYGATSKDTGTTLLATGTWYRISLYSPSSGTTKVELNGVEELSSVDLFVGLFPIRLGIQTSCTADLYFDDAAGDSATTLASALGDIRVELSQPNGIGYYSEFDTPTPSATHFENVDNNPLDAAMDDDYNQHAGKDFVVYDSYDIEDASAVGLGGSDIIQAVSTWIRAKRGGGGGTTMSVLIRDNGSDYTYLMAGIPTSYVWYSKYDADMPNDSAAWTQDRFNLIEVGGKKGTGGQDMYMSCAMVMVAFIPAVPCVEDITNSPNSYGFGTVATSSTTNTTINEFTVTNNSGNAVTIAIQGTDMLSIGGPGTVDSPGYVGGLVYDLSGTQRKAFYASGLYWVFYSNGTNLVYKTSSDGSNWSSETTVRVCTSGVEFSVWFDGTYVHYAYSSLLTGDPMYYRRGTPSEGGTISWSDEQIALSGVVGKAPRGAAISVDSAGYPWIGYQYYEPSIYPYVTKSSTNNGSWTTAANFPYKLDAVSQGWLVQPVPLTNQRVLAIYSYDDDTISSQQWNGSSWGSEKSAATNPNWEMFSAVNEGDDVHLVYLTYSAYNINYKKYTYSTDSWGAITEVQSSCTQYSAPKLTIDSSNNLYCFWVGSPTAHHIYFKRYMSGSWDANPFDWVDESSNQIDVNSRISVFYTEYGNEIGVVYQISASASYAIRFAVLDSGWTLSDTATPGSNIVGLKAGLDDDDDNFDIVVKKTAAYNDLVVGLADSATQDWGLQLLAPTSFGDGALKEGVVTLTATCD